MDRDEKTSDLTELSSSAPKSLPSLIDRKSCCHFNRSLPLPNASRRILALGSKTSPCPSRNSVRSLAKDAGEGAIIKAEFRHRRVSAAYSSLIFRIWPSSSEVVFTNSLNIVSACLPNGNRSEGLNLVPQARLELLFPSCAARSGSTTQAVSASVLLGCSGTTRSDRAGCRSSPTSP